MLLAKGFQTILLAKSAQKFPLCVDIVLWSVVSLLEEGMRVVVLGIESNLNIGGALLEPIGLGEGLLPRPQIAWICWPQLEVYLVLDSVHHQVCLILQAFLLTAVLRGHATLRRLEELVALRVWLLVLDVGGRRGVRVGRLHYVLIDFLSRRDVFIVLHLLLLQKGTKDRSTGSSGTLLVRIYVFFLAVLLLEDVLLV